VSAPPENIVLDFRRELTFTTPTKTTKGELVIERIAFLPELGAWGCYWRIDGRILFSRSMVTILCMRSRRVWA
jgi:hypothetical protein